MRGYDTVKKCKRVISLVAALVMCISAAGCSKKKDESSLKAETTTAAETTAVTTVATTKAPAKKKVTNGSLNVLTGLNDISKNAKGKRPVAVMVNNIDASLPQYGIYDADMLFEFPVEGGITRLMAMYGDYTQVPNVCSVRSCRYYYALFANSFDAIYLHWGIDKKIAQSMLDKYKIDHIDGNKNQTLFKRDEQRMQYYDIEHTGYCDGSLIPQEVKNAGIRTKIRSDIGKTAFSFNAKTTAVSKVKCKNLNINFSDSYSSGFSYDSKRKVYNKIRKGEKHIDASNNKQLCYTNVLVLESKNIQVVNQDNGLLSVDWKGGSGYLASGGTIRKIKWQKKGELDKLLITDEKGKTVKLNKGKTYIGVTKANTTSYSAK